MSMTTWSLTGSCTLTGSATLTSTGSTVPIIINGSSSAALSCPTPSICTTLGSAGNAAVFGLQGSTINLSSGPLRIHGNVGIGVSGQFNFSGGGIVTGTLFADPSAQVNISGGGTTVTGGTTRISMSPFQTEALQVSSAAASLTPTQTFSSITSSQTIVGNGGLNVILVQQLIHLSGGNMLIVSGGPSDRFVINVGQGLQLDGGANIVLQGVPASNALFNFPGSGSQMQTSGNAQTAGIFLAPNLPIQINGGVHNSEFISGQTLSFQSNPMVTQPCP
jgi:choice-of-anchor A domain-containing protein